MTLIAAAHSLSNSAGRDFVAYLAVPALRSLLVGGMAALALVALRVNRVAVRLQVWTAVLCAALAMPFLGASLPRVPLAVPASSVERISQRVSLLKAVVGGQRSGNSGEQTAKTAGVLGARDIALKTKCVAKSHGEIPATAGGLRFAQDYNIGRRAGPATAGKLKPAPTDKSVGAAWSVDSEQRGDRALAAWRTKRDTAAAASSANSEAKSEAAFPGAMEMPVMPLEVIPMTTESVATPPAQKAGALALGIYIFVAGILFVRLLVGMLLSHRLARAAQEISPKYFSVSDDAENKRGREALRLLRFRSSIVGLKSAPLLKESAAISVPATVGVAHAAILLPADWRTWPEEQLDAVLAHEVSHVARRDALTQALSLVHRAIFWFSPLAWWLDKQLTELAEQASDEAALAGGADRTRYAETLLAFFAQLQMARGRVWWQGVSMAKKSRAGSAERRVDRILAWKGNMSMKKSFAIVLVAFAAPVIFLAASLHPVIAYGQDKTQSDSQNVVRPGGPKAPALPNAPKGGVHGGVKGGVAAPAIAPAPAAAPAIANAPTGGAVAPAMPAAPATPAPQGGVAGAVRIMAAPSPRPALMPVPGAPAHPPIVPGPIANGPVTPSVATAPMTISVAAPSPGAPATPEAITAPLAPQATIVVGDSVSAQDAAAQLRAARKALADAQAQFAPASDQVRAAERALADARLAMEQAQADEQSASSVNIINGSYSYGSGPRYVMFTGENDISMSGDDEDLHHARELRKKVGKDLIWFERDEKSYIITDPAFIAKAKTLFAPEEALAKQQDELGRQQDELGRQQDALGGQMDKIKVKVPDITADLQRIYARLKELQAGGATQSELGRVQSELGELQSQVGRYQSEAGVQQSAIGRQQGELGRKQGELGRKQGELGRRQGQMAREASRQLRDMFDDAIAKGIAKPE